MTLYQITFTLNFLSLIVAVWLGLYLVTRNPRTSTAWLTALTLWSLAGLFLNILLALNPPPILRPSGLRFLFPFWPSGMFAEGANAWLQGWSVAPSIAFWHHATMLMRPGKMNAWRWFRVIGAYIVAIAAIEVQAFTQILFSVEGGDPLYLNSLHAGPLYSVFGLALIGLTVLAIINLARSMKVAPNDVIRRQLRTLVVATVFTGLIAPVSLVSSGLDIFPMPMVVMSGVLTVFMGMIGYGIARYSALVHNRIIDRDFFYNLLGILIVAGVYTAFGWLLFFAYEAPKVIVVFIPILGVFTHTVLNAAGLLFDQFFYRSETRRLRANLHDLRRLAGETETIHDSLDAILANLCAPIKATYGLILLHQNGETSQLASYRWKEAPLSLPSNLFLADDMLPLTLGHFPAPLDDAALLVPLYVESTQVGTLVLGRPINGVQYTPEDIDELLYPADQIASALALHLRNQQRLNQVAKIASEESSAPATRNSLPVQEVDLALRNLFDYAYLADSPLGDLSIVRQKLAGTQQTHIERGKVVNAVVVETIEKLRPNPNVPKEPVPREWYPYVILREAYVDEVQNKDIMSKLYISEGTFNRTRRSAIQSLARALAELENVS